MTRPNIVYVFADDLGYGDIACNNPDSKIQTPHVDALAERGMRFTDAHAGSSVCTPSRYNLLTGTYAWRSRLKRDVLWHWDGALLEEGQPTVAGFLKEEGYRTSCVGKWHLGWDWETTDGSCAADDLEYATRGTPQDLTRRDAFADKVDFTKRIAGGPTDHGFDSYFGVDVPNFPPYAWFEDDRLTEQPTETKPEEMLGSPGPMVPGWTHEQVLPELTRRAVAQIEAAEGGEPFFLFVPVTSPHTPIAPSEQFRGRSDVGAYGDFVMETDAVVGAVTDALTRIGQLDNTIIVFSSDNGPERRIPGTQGGEGTYERITTYGHNSAGPLRGIKRDAWEGGHRVPLIVSWPGVVPEGAVCDRLVSLGDLFATCADIVGRDVPAEAQDSVSMLPLLEGGAEPTRRCHVHHSMTGTFALRYDNWVFIDDRSGADGEEPEAVRAERGVTPHEQPGELFDLTEDLAQRRNLYAERPDVVQKLTDLLAQVKHQPQVQAVR